MNILVLNAGSSSLKYQVIDMPSEAVKCVGMVERIGMQDAVFSHSKGDINHKQTSAIANHEEALQKIATILLDSKFGVLNSVDELRAVGHRVVHGGNTFSKTTEITNEVKEKVRELFELAPLHNPANLIGIEVAEKIFPKAAQIGVFDTAFHQTMPQKAYQFSIDKKYLEDHNIRAYGFHGTSHKYVSEKVIEKLGIENSKIITIHLGNGCSMAALKNGKVIDTSMGLGPMNGLVMGTRSGDIDQSVIFFMMKKFNISAEEVKSILEKKSGMIGLTGYSDLREIEAEAESGNPDCKNALELAAYRIQKYIGSFAAALNGLDAIVFTAGIGENSSNMRKLVCGNMDFLGIKLDNVVNEIRSKEIREIQSKKSKVKVFVIPTNEELEIAKQSYQLIKS